MDKTSKIWNIETGIEIFEMRHEGEVIECSFNTDGDKILKGVSVIQKFWIHIMVI